MDISTVTSTAYAQKSPTQVSREIRQSTQSKGLEEAAQQRQQTEGRHAEKARIANEVFKDSVETTDSAAVDDGIDQMVRAVSRQRASEQSTESDAVEQDPNAREQFIRQRVDSAYSDKENQPPQRESSPSQSDQTARQQQQGAEVYRSSNRTGTDQTVELVI